MVKPDISRDYYEDLELKPGADTNEVKKQFKKLGAFGAVQPLAYPAISVCG